MTQQLGTCRNSKQPHFYRPDFLLCVDWRPIERAAEPDVTMLAILKAQRNVERQDKITSLKKQIAWAKEVSTPNYQQHVHLTVDDAEEYLDLLEEQ